MSGALACPSCSCSCCTLDPFDASSALAEARAQLDRDQFYSKLQHLIKQLAWPSKKISRREKNHKANATLLDIIQRGKVQNSIMGDCQFHSYQKWEIAQIFGVLQTNTQHKILERM